MKNNKPFYKRRYIIILYVFVSLIIINLFLPTEENNQKEIYSNITNDIKTDLEDSQQIAELEKEFMDSSQNVSNNYVVTRIIDGDTIELNTGERVRLICINTPEKGEFYYQEASNYLKNLILNEEIELIKDKSETDKYGRLLRYIYLNGKFINQEMVLKGYAVAYPYGQDISLCPEIEKAEDKAKNKHLGIWSQQESNEQEVTSSNSDIICSSNVYNCDDFSTCSEAKNVFSACGGINHDVHKLDQDLDGIPCEDLCG